MREKSQQIQVIPGNYYQEAVGRNYQDSTNGEHSINNRSNSTGRNSRNFSKTYNNSNSRNNRNISNTYNNSNNRNISGNSNSRNNSNSYNNSKNNTYSGSRTKNTYSARTLAKRRKARRIKKIRGCLTGICLLLFLVAGISILGRSGLLEHFILGKNAATASQAEKFLERMEQEDSGELYPEVLLEMLEKNEETYEYVTNYPNRDKYLGKEIDLSKDYESGKVPLLLQWDLRWGYDAYGAEMIGPAGCGPTCMTMAYLFLTGDTSMNPRRMAEYAYNNGYYTEAGTSWSFFTEGASGLGLQGNEISLSEAAMKSVLDNGGVVVCSMRPGDFTTTGHFIVIRGYDEKGFYVNDPNSRKNSEKQWEFDTLNPQIKCLWGINAA